MIMPRCLRNCLPGFGAAYTLLLSAFAAPAQGADLRVVVDEIGSSAGTIIAGLYDTEESYRQAVHRAAKVLVNDPIRRAGVTLRPTGRAQTIVFADLPPGLYAVVVFHDANDDGRFNKGILGMPMEPYGISNNPRAFATAPDFAAAAVRLADRDEMIRIALVPPNSGLSGEAR
jgi:uncharacterized protein (DUF2141 family)